MLCANLRRICDPRRLSLGRCVFVCAVMRSGFHVDMLNGLQPLRFPVSAVIAILNSDGLGHHSGLLSANIKLLFASHKQRLAGIVPFKAPMVYTSGSGGKD